MLSMTTAALLAAASAKMRDALLYGGAGLFVVLAGVVVIVWLRRRLHDGGAKTEAFSVEQLEVMRAEGRISDEEFRGLRRALLGLDAGPAKKDASGLSEPPEDDDGKEGKASDDLLGGAEEE